MYKEKTIGIVVPAYNEELLINKVIVTMPDFVDRIIIVDDGSIDKTKEIILKYAQEDERIILVEHAENKGLGQSLIDGYIKARDLELDAV